MLFLLLAACDPGFQSELTVDVSSDVVQTYAVEAPGLVAVEQITSSDGPAVIGTICGGDMDLRFTLVLNELGCGPGGTEVTVSLFPATALSEGLPERYACGNWATPMFLDLAGEPDDVEVGLYDEPEDPENRKCGGASHAGVRFD